MSLVHPALPTKVDRAIASAVPRRPIQRPVDSGKYAIVKLDLPLVERFKCSVNLPSTPTTKPVSWVMATSRCGGVPTSPVWNCASKSSECPPSESMPNADRMGVLSLSVQ